MNDEPKTIFDRIRDVLQDMETDDSIRHTQEWEMVKDRYAENETLLRELIEELP